MAFSLKALPLQLRRSVGLGCYLAWVYCSLFSCGLVPVVIRLCSIERSWVYSGIGEAVAAIVVIIVYALLREKGRGDAAQRMIGVLGAGCACIGSVLIWVSHLDLSWYAALTVAGGLCCGAGLSLLGILWGSRFSYCDEEHIESTVPLSFVISFVVYFVLLAVKGPLFMVVDAVLPVVSTWIVFRPRSQRLRRWGGGRCARSCRASQAVFSSGLPFCAVLSHLVSDRAVPRCVLADDVWRAIHALPRAVLHCGGACDCGVSHVHATDALPQLYVSLSLVGAADDYRLRPSSDRFGHPRAAQRCVCGQLHRHVQRSDVRVGCGAEVCEAYRCVTVRPVRRFVCCRGPGNFPGAHPFAAAFRCWCARSCELDAYRDGGGRARRDACRLQPALAVLERCRASLHRRGVRHVASSLGMLGVREPVL